MYPPDLKCTECLKKAITFQSCFMICNECYVKMIEKMIINLASASSFL